MNMTTLAREVEDILELPRMDRHGKGFKIVKAIVDTITKALLRGERVTIVGFGAFFPYTNKATRCSYPARFKDKGDFVTRGIAPPYRGKRGYKVIPERKTVHFRPSTDLKRSLYDH